MSMQSQDITYQLAHRDRAGIEVAFRAMVTGDQIVEGVGGPEAALDLLGKLAAALDTNERPLPHDLAASISGKAGGGPAVRTYGEGARAVLASLPRFVDMLAALYPEPTHGE